MNLGLTPFLLPKMSLIPGWMGKTQPLNPMEKPSKVGKIGFY